MTNRISPMRAALATGVLLALFHLTWAFMIWLGIAQAVIDFVLWLHMIKPFIAVEPFSVGRAAGLLALTGFSGMVLGLVLAKSWNALHRLS